MSIIIWRDPRGVASAPAFAEWHIGQGERLSMIISISLKQQ